MAYISKIHEQSYQIEIEPEGQRLKLNGESYLFDYQKIASLATAAQGGHYSLLIAGQSYDLFIRNISRVGEKGGQTYEILLGGQRLEVKIDDERAQLLNTLTGPVENASEAQIEAPMPGLVIGLPYAAGEEVQEGEIVVILEAMKMENDLTAPISGKIKELRISKGQSVDQGEVLVVIEARA